ncbi:hypothetical protein D9M72_572640 [compost metagenome]
MAVDASDEPSVVPALGVNWAFETSWSGSGCTTAGVVGGLAVGGKNPLKPPPSLPPPQAASNNDRAPASSMGWKGMRDGRESELMVRGRSWEQTAHAVTFV